MKCIALTLAAALLAATPALAHDDATLDAMQAPHGGQLRMAGAYHIELVLARDARGGKPAPVKVYLSDHGGSKIAPAGASGSVVLLAPAGKLTVPLAAAGDRLEGTAVYTADPATKALVSLRFADGKTETARFEPFKPR
ncbi:MAG: hypothetical protein PHI64_12180 [Zoogloea sp.]|uniref:hypothetical protein n=1 Tax=Zoogloea sp. TaxID=49181 RepID=UPI002627E5E7|nr:hypothetical protein [Zoogloea sp.]MDD2989705.1 hypothetical protein [Zoogloea sp.]